MAKSLVTAAVVPAIPALVLERLQQAKINIADPELMRAVGVAIGALDEVDKSKKGKAGGEAAGSTLDLNIPGLKLKLSGNLVHIVLSVAGLIAMVITLADRFPAFKQAVFQMFGGSASFELLTTVALAATAEPTYPLVIRDLVRFGIYGALGIVYLGSVYGVLFSADRRRRQFATDTFKTLSGFFIGSVSTLLDGGGSR